MNEDKRTRIDLEIMRDWHYHMSKANSRRLEAMTYDAAKGLSDVHVYESLLEWAMHRSEASEILEKL